MVASLTINLLFLWNKCFYHKGHKVHEGLFKDLVLFVSLRQAQHKPLCLRVILNDLCRSPHMGNEHIFNSPDFT